MMRSVARHVRPACRANMPLRSLASIPAVSEPAHRLLASYPPRRRYKSTTTAPPARTRPNPNHNPPAPPPAETDSHPELDKLVQTVSQSRQHFLSSGTIPAEPLILTTLGTFLRAAAAVKPLLGPRKTSNLLQLEKQHRREAKRGVLNANVEASVAAGSGLARNRESFGRPDGPAVQNAVAEISAAAFDVLSHPNTVITSEALDIFVDVHFKLGASSHLLEGLELFGSKLLPRATSAGNILYTVPPSPNGSTASIPLAVAEKAVDTAIAARDLAAAVAIVEQCYGTKAYAWAKYRRDGIKPTGVVVMLPVISYLLARLFADFQNVSSHKAAAVVAFLGIMTYFFNTGALGVLGMVGRMDHHKRVTWAPGTPLRTRWMREEQRAAYDRIACAWGFKESWRHGEEAGIEWESLKEYLLLKNMILDRVEFMEGLE